MDERAVSGGHSHSQSGEAEVGRPRLHSIDRKITHARRTHAPHARTHAHDRKRIEFVGARKDAIGSGSFASVYTRLCIFIGISTDMLMYMSTQVYTHVC